MQIDLFGFFKTPHFKEKYNEDIHFADNLTPQYKEFEIKYNEILKQKYPSISDDMKRQYWISKKIKLKTKDIDEIEKGMRNLIGTNFDNVDLINDENSYLVKYLIEKRTGKIYKVNKFKMNSYYYSTLSDKSILTVRFDIKLNKRKNKVIIKYTQGYLTEQAFSLMTMSEMKQGINANVEFKNQFVSLENKVRNYFNLPKKGAK